MEISEVIAGKGQRPLQIGADAQVGLQCGIRRVLRGEVPCSKCQGAGRECSRRVCTEFSARKYRPVPARHRARGV